MELFLNFYLVAKKQLYLLKISAIIAPTLCATRKSMTKKTDRKGKISKKNKLVSAFIITVLGLVSLAAIVEAFINPTWTYTGNATNNTATFVNTSGNQIIGTYSNTYTTAWFDDSTGSKLSVKVQESDNSTPVLTVDDGNADNTQFSDLRIVSDNNHGAWVTWIATDGGGVSKLKIAHIGLRYGTIYQTTQLIWLGTLDDIIGSDTSILVDRNTSDKLYDIVKYGNSGFAITYRKNSDGDRYVTRVDQNGQGLYVAAGDFPSPPYYYSFDLAAGSKWASLAQGSIAYTDSSDDLNLVEYGVNAYSNWTFGVSSYHDAAYCSGSNHANCGLRLTSGAETVSDPELFTSYDNGSGISYSYIIYKNTAQSPAQIKVRNGYYFSDMFHASSSLALDDCGTGQYALNCTSVSNNAYTATGDGSGGAIIHWRDGNSSDGNKIGHLQYYNKTLTRQWDANPSGLTENSHAYAYPANNLAVVTNSYNPFYFNNGNPYLNLTWSGSPMTCVSAGSVNGNLSATCTAVNDNALPRIYTTVLLDAFTGTGNHFLYTGGTNQVSPTTWQLTNTGVSPAINSPASNSGTTPVPSNTAYWTDDFPKNYDSGAFYNAPQFWAYQLGLYTIYNRSGNAFNDSRTNTDNYLSTINQYGSAGNTKIYSADTINQSAADQRNIQVVKTGTTDTMFFYEDDASSDASISGHKIYGEKYNAAGTAQWNHKYLGINFNNDEEETNLNAIPSIVNGTKDGDAIFVYSATSATGNVGKLVIQKVDANGNTVSTANPNGFIIRSDLISGSYTGIHDISMISDNAGGAFITWIANINNTNNRVYATHMTWDNNTGDWGGNTQWANNHTQTGEMTNNSDDYTPRFVKYGSNLFLVYSTLEEGTSSHKKIIIQKLDPTTGLPEDPDVKKIIEDQGGDITLNNIFFSQGPDQGGGTYDSANYALFVAYMNSAGNGFIDKYDMSLAEYTHGSAWPTYSTPTTQILNIMDDNSGGVIYVYNSWTCTRNGCSWGNMTMTHLKADQTSDWSSSFDEDYQVDSYGGCTSTDVSPMMISDNNGGVFVTWQKNVHCDRYIWVGYYYHSVTDGSILDANHIILGQKLWSGEFYGGGAFNTNKQLVSDGNHGFVTGWETRASSDTSTIADVKAQGLVEPLDNSNWTITTNHINIVNDNINTTTDGHYAKITVTVPTAVSSIVLTQQNNPYVWNPPTIANINCSDDSLISGGTTSSSSGTQDGNHQVCFKVTNSAYDSSTPANNVFSFLATTTGSSTGVVPQIITLTFAPGSANLTTSTFTTNTDGPLLPNYDPNNPTNPHDIYYFTVNLNDGVTNDYGYAQNNPIPGKTITLTPDHDTGLTYSAYACNDGETPGVTNSQGNACFMAQANVEDTFNFNAYDTSDSNSQIGSTLTRAFAWPPDNNITTDSTIDLLSPTGVVYTSPKRILADHNGNIVLKVTAKNAEQQTVKAGNDVRITLNSNPDYCTFQNPNPYNESCEWFGSAGWWNGYFANYGNSHGGLTDSGNAFNPAGRSAIPSNYQASYWRVSCGDENPPNTFGETVTDRLYNPSNHPAILDSNVQESTLTAYPTQIFTNGDQYSWPSNLPPQPYTDSNGILCYKFAMGGNAKINFHAKVEQTTTYDNEGYNMTAWINTANSQTVYFYLLADNTTTINASPSSVLADGATTSTITVNLKNNSTSLSDKPVSLNGSRNNLSTIQAVQCSSNSNGETVTITDATHTTTNQAGDACFTVASSSIGNETFTAHDDDTNGIDANSVQVHFLDASAPPEGVIDLNGTPGDGAATLTWSAPASVYPITSYEVHYSTDNFVNDDQTCSNSTCTDTTPGASITGLTNGTLYYFKVYAYNQNGKGAVSNIINLTPVAPPPAAVSDLGGNAGNAMVSLTWSAPSSSAPITSYVVHYSTDNFVNSDITCNTTECTDTTPGTDITGLTNGITYYFKVYAVSSGGTSGVSNIINLTPAAPLIVPDRITDLAAQPVNKSATLTWTPPADNGNAITSYIIEMDTNPNFTNFQPVTDTDGNPLDGAATITGLTNNTTYYFRVSAHNLAGNGPVSNTASVTPACNLISNSFCLSLNIYSETLSFTDIPSSFSFQSLTQGPADQSVYSVDNTNQPSQTSLLGVYDNRNNGGFQVQVQAEGTFTNGTDVIPLSNLYIGTSTSSTSVSLPSTTVSSGVIYDSSISTKGITASASLGNGSPTSPSSYSVNLGNGPVVLMNGALRGGSGRNGHMYQLVNYYLNIPAHQKPGNYSVNLIYTLTDSSN